MREHPLYLLCKDHNELWVSAAQTLSHKGESLLNINILGSESPKMMSLIYARIAGFGFGGRGFLVSAQPDCDMQWV